MPNTNKINYIKPQIINEGKKSTVTRSLPIENKKNTRPVYNNRMTVEERNLRLEKVREYQEKLKLKKVTTAELKNRQTQAMLRASLADNQTLANDRVFTYSSIEPIWQDQTVYIVGGGPSLTGFDFSRLQGKNVIAVNKAYAYVKQPFILYWTDSRFYKWYQSEIDALNCMKITSSNNIKDMREDILFLKNTANKELNLDSKPYEIHAGNNSGYGAIHLAIKLGAKKVYLLGYDMQHESNKSHWHGGYPSPANHRESIYKSMMQFFDKNANTIKSVIDVYNANPKSALKCFNFCTVDEALASS